VSQANGGIIKRDMRQGPEGPRYPAQIPMRRADREGQEGGELYEKATLPLGDGTQTPDDFARSSRPATGLPEHMCKGNMSKNSFVLEHGEDSRLPDARAAAGTS
jgi:hypothetical protein